MYLISELDLKIYKTKFELINHGKATGLLVAEKTNLKVYCAGGLLEILEVQLEGKKRMGSVEFLRGFRPTNDCRLF